MDRYMAYDEGDPMSSLKKINADAGTNFRRWKEVTAVVKEANEPPPAAPVVQAVNCAKCGGTLHAEGNYPNLFRCGDCDTVQKLEAETTVAQGDGKSVGESGVASEQHQPAPEVQAEPTEAEVREPRTSPTPEPDFPRKVSDRVAYQMRGRGITVTDGWPVAGGRGTFTTPDETWKYDEDGQVILVWEHVSWKVQRDSMYEAIIGQPLVRAGDGSVDVSMFTAHHAWIDYLSEYRQKKLDAVKEGIITFATDRVAWFQDGISIYQTTIGSLLEQSLNSRE